MAEGESAGSGNILINGRLALTFGFDAADSVGKVGKDHELTAAPLITPEAQPTGQLIIGADTTTSNGLIIYQGRRLSIPGTVATGSSDQSCSWKGLGCLPIYPNAAVPSQSADL